MGIHCLVLAGFVFAGGNQIELARSAHAFSETPYLMVAEKIAVDPIRIQLDDVASTERPSVFRKRLAAILRTSLRQTGNCVGLVPDELPMMFHRWSGEGLNLQRYYSDLLRSNPIGSRMSDSEFGHPVDPSLFSLASIRQHRHGTNITSHWFFSSAILVQSPGKIKRADWLKAASGILGARLEPFGKGYHFEFDAATYRERYIKSWLRRDREAKSVIERSRAQYIVSALRMCSNADLEKAFATHTSSCEIPIQDGTEVARLADFYLASLIAAPLSSDPLPADYPDGLVKRIQAGRHPSRAMRVSLTATGFVALSIRLPDQGRYAAWASL